MAQIPGTEFDFFFGDWDVQHHRLITRLAEADDWQEFSGVTSVQPILGGNGNMDDNLINLSGSPYRAISLRTYNPSIQKWAIWWLDGRTSHDLDVPVIGQFEDGIGTFIANDTFDAQPIRMRFTWTKTETETPRWEQAFSSDDGVTWEINWIMNFKRK
ncbi:DUF1579 domain-containing protein [Alphaproteobacteria bacterium 46_93_T64]|nr:DUF1579 domain-containing protein [Alphaproteobacteria bacterium 46_93_T64]